MAQVELKAEPRTVVGKKVRHLRREGWVPAVLYGPGVKSRPLQVPAAEAEDVVRRAGTSQLIAVRIGRKKEAVQALVRGLQRDSVRRNLLHFDLYQVQMAKAITVEVPIVLVGVSPVIERGEGILLQGAQTVEIECLPSDLIDAMEVDLSDLTEVDQQITVGGLAVPSSITILSDLDEMVVRVSPLEEIPEEEEELVEEIVPEAELAERPREEGEEEVEEE